MIGRIFIAKSNAQRYVLKIFRDFNTALALQSIDIIKYLVENNYPVVSMIPAKNGELYIKIDLPEGECIGILYDFIEGSEPDLYTKISEIGEQIGEVHNLMSKFPGKIVLHDKEFFIDRFTKILQKLEYDPAKINVLENYGMELWSRIGSLPKGFCHGDLHSGNMFQNRSNQFILFDFDAAALASPIVDVASLCNCSDFNVLEKSSYNATRSLFERFYQGYSRKRDLTDLETSCIFDFIAVRHYELISTIVECQGLKCINKSFLDEQYSWLINWRSICK